MSSPYVDPIVDALQRFTTPFPGDVRDLPAEPEQTFLLGNRYADYGLAVVFALAFPLLRAVLRRLVYVVRPCNMHDQLHAPCDVYLSYARSDRR